jgi:hypothetical protein
MTAAAMPLATTPTAAAAKLSVETVNEELSLGTKNIKRVTIELVINDHKITSGTGITRQNSKQCMMQEGFKSSPFAILSSTIFFSAAACRKSGEICRLDSNLERMYM